MVKIVTSRNGPPARPGSRRRSVASSVKPSLRGDAEARLVAGIDMDLDPVGLADLDSDTRQRRGRLRGDPLPRGTRTDPVADVHAARACPRMQASAPKQPPVSAFEETADVLLVGVERCTETATERVAVLDRLRQIVRPRHKRSQVLDARVQRLGQQGRIGRLVAADHEPLCLDPVRSGRALPAHATRPTRTQPLWPPRPIAFESATSTCVSRASLGT